MHFRDLTALSSAWGGGGGGRCQQRGDFPLFMNGASRETQLGAQSLGCAGRLVLCPKTLRGQAVGLGCPKVVWMLPPII